MKKLITLLIILFPFVGFGNEHSFKCSYVNGGVLVKRSIKRCENKEAVCYYMVEGGMQCKFK